MKNAFQYAIAAVCAAFAATSAGAASPTPVGNTAASHPGPNHRAEVRHAVDAIVQPLMREYAIPGMAVGVVIDGHPYVFNYGVASKQTGQAVNGETLFELGSVSKTFTATLSSWAAVQGKLSLNSPISGDWSTLDGTSFGALTPIQLGTHISGGLPLQVPDDVRNEADLVAYLKSWRPTYAPDTERTYSNVSIGMLGLITAKSLGQPFAQLAEQRLFPALGLTHSYIVVPPDQQRHYAQGYTSKGQPIRLKGDVLSDASYGVRSTAADMLRFVEINLGLHDVEPSLHQAIVATRTGYYQAAAMTQDLIWEQYPYPVALPALLAGNATTMIDVTPVKKIDPPLAPNDDTWVNKTGSTNGFGAYIAFVPSQQTGIVMLANRNYPIPARVTAAYRILSALEGPEANDHR